MRRYPVISQQMDDLIRRLGELRQRLGKTEGVERDRVLQQITVVLDEIEVEYERKKGR